MPFNIFIDEHLTAQNFLKIWQPACETEELLY